MMIAKTYLPLLHVICGLTLILGYAMAQPRTSTLDDESDLIAETKQVNQFFRRFNGEESAEGKRLYPGDSSYQQKRLRSLYIKNLFDKENRLITDSQKAAFLDQVLHPENTLLDFHGGAWFAEVNTQFLFKGKPISVTLYMEIEAAQVGSKWVISKAHVPYFDSLFLTRKGVQADSFLHPMSHEIDFINLNKVFRNQRSLKPFTANRRPLDHLTLFLQSWDKGDLRFKGVTHVKFHFFQVENWYFELTYFNRGSFNKGWLISALTQIPDLQKPVLQSYIQHNQP